MKFIPFIFKHLKRNWIRTGSTVFGMALCIFLFCTLQTVLYEINGLLEGTSANRLITRHGVSLVFNLPLSYAGRIESVPGVKGVATTAWFGGSLPAKKEGKVEGSGGSGGSTGGDAPEATTDWSNFFPNMAVDSEKFFPLYPEYQIDPQQLRDYMGELKGAMIGRKLADKFGWKVGDRFFLESFIPPYRKQSGPFEFVVMGIFDADPVKNPKTDTNIMYFHYKYLYEGTGQRIGAGTYTIGISDPEQAGVVSKAIDTLFENSDAQTHTETEAAFAASFIAMAGNLALLLNTIGLAVIFTILLVTANTMSMAVRERRTEIAVLKTLGFGSAKVMGLIVAEAVFLGALGGGVGILASRGIIFLLTSTPGIKDMLAGMGLSSLTLPAPVAALGFSVALLLGLLAGFVPAFNAYRSKITDMLRTV
jgi:putative ABC transport system permease protein